MLIEFRGVSNKTIILFQKNYQLGSKFFLFFYYFVFIFLSVVWSVKMQFFISLSAGD